MLPRNRNEKGKRLMNITIKINDELAKQARHEAVDDGLSLSGWVSELIKSKLVPCGKGKTLLESLGNEELADVELDFPRSQSTSREISF